MIPDVDSGPIILQGSIDIDPTEGPDKLSGVVLNSRTRYLSKSHLALYRPETRALEGVSHDCLHQILRIYHQPAVR